MSNQIKGNGLELQRVRAAMWEAAKPKMDAANAAVAAKVAANKAAFEKNAASARVKLKALGLTDDEINALIGA